MIMQQHVDGSFSPDHYQVNLSASGNRIQQWPQQKLFQRTVIGGQMHAVNQRKASAPQQPYDGLHQPHMQY